MTYVKVKLVIKCNQVVISSCFTITAHSVCSVLILEIRPNIRNVGNSIATDVRYKTFKEGTS